MKFLCVFFCAAPFHLCFAMRKLKMRTVVEPNIEDGEEPADQYGHHGGDDEEERMPQFDTYSGRNLVINYTYNFKTDCYGDGSGNGYRCPAGTWCQVSARPNWYPWDVSYMNRGRCLQYQPIGGACEEAYEGETAFPRKANGEFFSRPVHCAPHAICTGEDFNKVLPSMCTLRRDPRHGCMSSKPFCAGRPLEGGCPGKRKDFCICPKGSTQGSCRNTSQVTKTKLEQCGSVFNSMNGPNFAFIKKNEHPDDNHGLPNDNNIEPNTSSTIFKLPLQHGQNPDIGNNILRRLWPYPVCSDEDTEKKGCTQFPLPVLDRGVDGNILDSYTTNEKARWLPKDGRGVVDYHCTWMMMHTLSFNGNPVLTVEEEGAFADMVMYISGQFDCKVCRNHFVHIIEKYGLPTGNLRETYARWLWRAHNIANEHTYATHSPDKKQLKKNPQWTPKDLRSSMWGNPNYEHPWYMSFSDALATWSGVV